jgi:hypothetical protein
MTDSPGSPVPPLSPLKGTLRVARATNDLSRVSQMYESALGLDRLGSFVDHDGFSGVMLGYPGFPYHFEFTEGPDHGPLPRPHGDTLLVFYVADKALWAERCQSMIDAGFQQVLSLNPYWDKEGRTFEDVDGYRVVIQYGNWPGE